MVGRTTIGVAAGAAGGALLWEIALREPCKRFVDYALPSPQKMEVLPTPTDHYETVVLHELASTFLDTWTDPYPPNVISSPSTSPTPPAIVGSVWVMLIVLMLAIFSSRIYSASCVQGRRLEEARRQSSDKERTIAVAAPHQAQLEVREIAAANAQRQELVAQEAKMGSLSVSLTAKTSKCEELDSQLVAQQTTIGGLEHCLAVERAKLDLLEQQLAVQNEEKRRLGYKLVAHSSRNGYLQQQLVTHVRDKAQLRRMISIRGKGNGLLREKLGMQDRKLHQLEHALSVRKKAHSKLQQRFVAQTRANVALVDQFEVEFAAHAETYMLLTLTSERLQQAETQAAAAALKPSTFDERLATTAPFPTAAHARHLAVGSQVAATEEQPFSPKVVSVEASVLDQNTTSVEDHLQTGATHSSLALIQYTRELSVPLPVRIVIPGHAEADSPNKPISVEWSPKANLDAVKWDVDVLRLRQRNNKDAPIPFVDELEQQNSYVGANATNEALAERVNRPGSTVEQLNAAKRADQEAMLGPRFASIAKPWTYTGNADEKLKWVPEFDSGEHPVFRSGRWNPAFFGPGKWAPHMNLDHPSNPKKVFVRFPGNESVGSFLLKDSWYRTKRGLRLCNEKNANEGIPELETVLESIEDLAASKAPGTRTRVNPASEKAEDVDEAGSGGHDKRLMTVISHGTSDQSEATTPSSTGLSASRWAA